MQLPTSPLSLHEIYRGRHVFILGATGFVGKVLLAMLLDRFPEMGRVYVMVRRGSGTSSEERFWNNVVTSPVFDPAARETRRRRGAGGLPDATRSGWSTATSPSPTWGSAKRPPQAVAEDIDVVINSSGKVTFNPPLESALRTNVAGHQERHRLRQAHEASGAVAHQHLLRRWQPLGRGVGERGAGGVFPAPARAARHPASPSSRRSPTATAWPPRCGPRPTTPRWWRVLRERARERLKEQGRDPDDEGVAEAGAGARAQGLGPPGADRPRGEAGGRVGLAQHLHLHQEHGRPAGGPGDRHRPHHRPPGHRRELARATRSPAGTRASPPRRRWSTWR